MYWLSFEICFFSDTKGLILISKSVIPILLCQISSLVLWILIFLFLKRMVLILTQIILNWSHSRSTVQLVFYSSFFGLKWRNLSNVSGEITVKYNVSWNCFCFFSGLFHDISSTRNVIYNCLVFFFPYSAVKSRGRSKGKKSLVRRTGRKRTDNTKAQK